MGKISLVVEIHQPMRLRTYRFSEIMDNHYYYDDYENEYLITRTSEKSYLPANKILIDLINYFKGSFKLSFMFSGVVLDQFELYAPEMINNFRSFISTGCVELLSGTYSNTFSSLINSLIYKNQLKLQREKVKQLFGSDPVALSFRKKSDPGYIKPGIRIFSDSRKSGSDVSLFISAKDLCNWSSVSERLVKVLNKDKENESIITIFIPYYISGSYMNLYSGLQEFLESFPSLVLSGSGYTFINPSEVVNLLPVGTIDNKHKKLTGYSGTIHGSVNKMQADAYEKLYSFDRSVENCNDPVIKKDWLYLQSGDHFFFMNSRLYKDSESIPVYIPYDSPYFAYINYMNVLKDFACRLGPF